MTPIFVYGTLRYAPLLRVVAGADVTPVTARLPGHIVSHAGDEPYPRLDVGAGHAEGLLIPAEHAARLDYYEGSFGYVRRAVVVEAASGPVEAQAYFPDSADVPAPGGPWLLSHWEEAWGKLAVLTASEAMEYFGEIDGATLAARMPMIQTRAWTQVLAEEGMAPATLGPVPTLDIQMVDRRRPYTHFFSVIEADLRQPRFDGTLSPTVNRAALIAADAVVVLPYDPARDRVLLIQQFRVVPLFRGDPHCFLVEAVAGRIDPGESPDAAARRELLEEASLTAETLHLISRNYPSSGACTEYVHTYVAITDLPDGAEGMGGLAEENEDIRSHILPYTEFETMLDAGQLNVGPLIIAGHWLARNRERLRSEA
ncbi:MAG: NUDIX domain-containing protein [Pseudomonadota bacterium]